MPSCNRCNEWTQHDVCPSCGAKLRHNESQPLRRFGERELDELRALLHERFKEHTLRLDRQ